MNSPYLSRFTPSIMTPEVLEAVFVQREQVAERLVELVKDSAATRSKHHSLLIGPRGIGKTHLVSLVYHRVKALDATKNKKLLIAWLREEEWGVMSFLDFLLRVHRALIAEYKDEELASNVEDLYKMEAPDAERAAARLLLDFVKNRTLLLIIENLDDLFGGFGEEGQMRLRSLIQENPQFTILAASQSLFGGVSLQTSPFYGFFRVVHLNELSIDDATRLVKKIAELNNDRDLAGIIETSLGHARISVLHRLAGGNHRVYIIFSEFLTRESFNELIDAMMRTLDELTPYYQERIRWLSPQQRKVVELLCDRGSALSVKEIASRSFMTHQTASGQLKILRELGYVRSNPVGRESYYELREPLMRLCVEVKKHRAKPIRLIVDLLRSWYTTEELRERLDCLPIEDADNPRSEREHIQTALNQYQSAEVIFSLSNPERIVEALGLLIKKEDCDRELNAAIVAGAARKMSYITMRRYQFERNWAESHEEDVAQTALLKLFEIIEKSPDKLNIAKNPVGYLYSIVRNTANDSWRKHYRQAKIEVPDTSTDETFDFEGVKFTYEQIIDQNSISPDSLIDLRTVLMQKTQSYLLKQSFNLRVLKERVNDLAFELKEAGAEDVLSESLIRSALYLAKGDDQDLRRLKKFFETIKEELTDSADFTITLRVVSKIVEYSETKDARVILDLRPEERTFLEPLFQR